jgi:hypothetical protein
LFDADDREVLGSYAIIALTIALGVLFAFAVVGLGVRIFEIAAG